MQILDHQVDLRKAKAGNRQIKVEIKFFQHQEIFAQEALIPMCVEREFVVGDPQGL